jgi:ribosome-associated protein
LSLDKNAIAAELTFRTSRSSGSGGQHVNKVSTKVELIFDLVASKAIGPEQRLLLQNTYANRLTKEGLFILSCDETRSQLRNKQKVTKRFFDLLEIGIQPPVQRKVTKVPKGVKKKRLETKKRRSEIKQYRRKPPVN